MTCTACGHENPERAKFCLECGGPLVLRCASCGTELPPAARFCLECGAALAPRPVAPNSRSGSRKIVTIVFADLVGSTALHERLDAEAVRHFMESYYAAMRRAVEAHGGRVTQLMGDGVKAVFGAPRVAEDDAIRAVRAAVEMQRAFRALAERQQGRVGKTGLRVAVNTGEVVAEEGQEIIGDPVNVAARLQEQGRDGDVVIGGSTERLVASLVTLDRLGSFALKGRSEAVEAYRVVSLEPPAVATTTPFVGRDEEMARLAAVYETAVAKPAAKLAVLVASPGLGKSRLIGEFVRRLGDTATVLATHCDPAGGASFAPLVPPLRRHFGGDGRGGESLRAAVEAVLPGDEAERGRILGGVTALIAGSPASPEETFFAVRRLLAALATVKPVVLVIDDLHWAEPLLFDLVEHLVQWGGGVPLFVLVGARPEMRDLRSSLVTPGGFASDVVTLAGLDAGAATRLAASVIGAADLPAAVAAKVLATSEGNPLFVGELVRMLVQEGALTKEGERWTSGAGLAALEMPPTIHALLAARIERLRSEESAVLERAAVVGRHFSRGAVAALLPGEAADLDARLESLRRSELIEPDSGWLLGEPVLRFHHVLIRDAAYRRLLKGTRAELHERLAGWIEARVGDAAEHDETIGWHLEQAHRHLSELGPIDARGRALGGRAAARLAAAGRRALARDDVPLAASLLGRAVERLDVDDPTRADLALDWCEALLSAGDVGVAGKAIDELGRFAKKAPFETPPEGGGSSGRAVECPSRSPHRLSAWHTCFAGQLRALTAPEELQATADDVARAAEEFVALGDSAGEAKAHFVRAQALARLGRVASCEAALDKALAAAREAGDRRRANAVLAGAPLAALWGPSPVTRASGRCLDVVRVLRITQGAPVVEALALSCQGVLEALRGRTAAARRMIASARRMVEELGIQHRLFETDVFAARVDLLDGDALAAERKLRAAYEGLRDLGLGIDAARAGALLARALLACDRVEEAERLTHASEQLAGDDLQAAIAWRGVRAEALARRGRHAEAVTLAEAAVGLAAATDALLDHADARLALAAALRAAGRRDEADAEERRAVELWRAKGATLLAERAGRHGAESASAPAVAASRVDAPPAASRSTRANAASAFAVRFERAFATGDSAQLEALWSETLQVVDHPNGATYGRDAHLASVRRLRQAHDPRIRFVLLATLGESLCLCRRHIAASGAGSRFDIGDYEREEIVLFETDERLRCRQGEVFGAAHLGDAIVRLYERHAELLPEGAERERGAAIARTVARLLEAREPLETAFASGCDIVDHRTEGLGAGRGVEWIRRLLASASEFADGLTDRLDDLLAAEPDGLLLRWTLSGVLRASGGAFESPHLRLHLLGADGLVTRSEVFDADREEEALARFAELTVGATSTRVRNDGVNVEPRTDKFANAATRALRAFEACWRARDWEGACATYHPAHRMDDRRRLMRVVVAGEAFFANERLLFEYGCSAWQGDLVATRGDRLALFRVRFTATAEGSGPMEVEVLDLVEVDAAGRRIALVVFDPDDLDAAYAEIDARWETDEGAHAVVAVWRTFRAAIKSRDWDAVAEGCAPTFVADDHRLVGWGTLRGPAALRPTLQAMTDLAPDVRMRTDHVRVDGRAALNAIAWVGTRDGGAFESPFLSVIELDADGRALRIDFYDTHHLEQALARFEEIGRSG